MFSLVPDIELLLNEASVEDIIQIPNKDLKGSKDKLAAIYSANFPVESIDNPFLITSELAKLLESEMYSDVVLELQDGKQFRCHKSILAARTQYFNTMFYGSWKESFDMTIKLLGFSSSVFELVLNFIYTANPELPQDIDIVDLLIAQDMLNVEGFIGVIKHHLKAHYCHFFHQPCESCLDTITSLYNLIQNSKFLGYENITESCDNWFVRNYSKIFSNRSFLKIPQNVRDSIMEKVMAAVDHVNIIGYLKECSKIKFSLPNVKWGIEASKYVTKLESHCLEFTCSKFVRITQQPAFSIILFEEKNLHISVMILEMFESALKNYMNFDNCLPIYERVYALKQQLLFHIKNEKEKDLAHSELFLKNASKVTNTFVKKNLIKIRRTKAWKEFPDEMKDELSSNAGFFAS